MRTTNAKYAKYVVGVTSGTNDKGVSEEQYMHKAIELSQGDGGETGTDVVEGGQGVDRRDVG